MIDINFLRKRRLIFSKTELKDKKIFYVALAVFSVSALILMGSLSASFYLKSQIEKTIAEQKQTTSVILTQEETEKEFLIFTNKLSAIKDIFENRSDKQEAIKFFSTLFGDDVFIDGMNYNGSSGALELKSVSKNVFDLENTFKLLENDEVTEKFDSLEKSGLGRSVDGEYSMSLNVKLMRGEDMETSDAK